MLILSALHLFSTIMQCKHLLLASSLSIISSLPPCHAWGTVGHETIAWIAQSTLSDDAATFVKGALGSKASDFMANVSTWADSYRYTSGGGWSAPLHYIDANDSPPDECDVVYDRDCGEEGCVVSAIVNYTGILVGGDASKAEALDAMRFLIHFGKSFYLAFYSVMH